MGHTNVDSTSTIDMYLKYAKDFESNKEMVQIMFDCNKNNCAATRIIKDELFTCRDVLVESITIQLGGLLWEP